ARPRRVAAIAVVSGRDASSTGGGHAPGVYGANRLRPCLRPGTLYRRMDRGDRCSQLVRARDRAAEGASLAAVGAFQGGGLGAGAASTRGSASYVNGGGLPGRWTAKSARPAILQLGEEHKNKKPALPKKCGSDGCGDRI